MEEEIKQFFNCHAKATTDNWNEFSSVQKINSFILSRVLHFRKCFQRWRHEKESKMESVNREQERHVLWKKSFSLHSWKFIFSLSRSLIFYFFLFGSTTATSGFCYFFLHNHRRGMGKIADLFLFLSLSFSLLSSDALFVDDRRHSLALFTHLTFHSIVSLLRRKLK